MLRLEPDPYPALSSEKVYPDPNLEHNGSRSELYFSNAVAESEPFQDPDPNFGQNGSGSELFPKTKTPDPSISKSGTLRIATL